MPRKTDVPPETQPSALDMLDPAPVPVAEPVPPGREPPPPPEPYQPGFIEQAVMADLLNFPAEFARGAIAASALRLARELDMGLVVGRDAAGHAREIRQSITTLREMSPGERQGDKTDDLRTRREARMQASVLCTLRSRSIRAAGTARSSWAPGRVSTP
jgi:hypothetical protein